MRKFWGVCKNDNYLVGCNGRTIYIYDRNNVELARFQDVNAVYRAKFVPNTNILIGKSTAGFLVIYDLDKLKLIKKICFSQIGGAQDEGFICSPDGKYLFNIEKPLESTKTQLTVYNTSDFEVVKILFKCDGIVLDYLEFDEDDNTYALGYVRNSSGVFDYGFVGKFLNDDSIIIKRIDKKRYHYVESYKSLEEKGFTERALEWSLLRDEEKIEKISLVDIYNSCENIEINNL